MEMDTSIDFVQEATVYTGEEQVSLLPITRIEDQDALSCVAVSCNGLV